MVDYEALRDAVNAASLEDGEIISCGGYDHYVLHSVKKDGWDPAEYIYPSDMVDGIDIYLWKSHKREFKRAIIVHEIAEFLYLCENYGLASLVRKAAEEFRSPRLEAHTFARDWDDRYARETFNDEMYITYCTFRELLLNGKPSSSEED